MLSKKDYERANAVSRAEAMAYITDNESSTNDPGIREALLGIANALLAIDATLRETEAGEP
jgi:hypothetical protein